MPDADLLSIDGQRARGLPRLGVPHRRGGVLPGLPDAGRVRRVRGRRRAPDRGPDRRRRRAAPDPPLRQPLRFLLRGREPRRRPRGALHPRRRLPPLVPLRQLRDADQPQAARHRPDHPLSAVAAVRLGARHRSADPPLGAPQSAGARHPAAAAPLCRPRHRVPHPDRDVARRERRRGAARRRSTISGTSARRCSRCPSCRSG